MLGTEDDVLGSMNYARYCELDNHWKRVELQKVGVVELEETRRGCKSFIVPEFDEIAKATTGE